MSLARMAIHNTSRRSGIMRKVLTCKPVDTVSFLKVIASYNSDDIIHEEDILVRKEMTYLKGTRASVRPRWRQYLQPILIRAH